MKTSFIVITYNRKDETADCIRSIANQTVLPYEIILIDNNSTDGTDSLFRNDVYFKNLDYLSYIKLEQNIGVAGGRNEGIRRAKGDILIFVDDDALLEPPNASELITKKFIQNPQTGILAFKIVNYYTKTIMREEFPHLNKWLNPDIEFETTCFIGAGHAIRKELFQNCGLYPENYFYGGEEFDFSFRVLDKGYQIWYFPDIVVWHKKSPKGRLSNSQKWILTYRNRLAMTYKYLYRRNLFVITITWFIKIVLVSHNIFTAFKGFIAFIKFKHLLKKQTINKEVYNKISKLKGRIWY